ncbi:MAG: hypothetical protein NUV59_01650 [Patescibacteria group bacterium]|nr:hypothetical protein [Patescibacteria group bacterium]
MKIGFVAFDAGLGSDVGDSILPHLRRQVPEADIGFLSSGTTAELDAVDLLVNCMSALHSEWSFDVLNRALGARMPCALIVRDENREHWQELSRLHREVARFRFVVAIGGPRAQLKEMFPRTSLAYDITSIREPGALIAHFIAQGVWSMMGGVQP